MLLNLEKPEFFYSLARNNCQLKSGVHLINLPDRNFRKMDGSSSDTALLTGRRKKNAPAEMSSKKPSALPFPSGSSTVKKQRYRDPRFDDRCGEFTTNSFEKDYKFVFDLRQKELDAVKKQLRKEKDPEAREKIKNLLDRLENQERSRMQKKKVDVKEAERKSLQKKRATEGKTPFYLKKADKSLLDMVSQFEDLKKTGKLKSFIEKKRKRNARAESKLLPGNEA